MSLLDYRTIVELHDSYIALEVVDPQRLLLDVNIGTPEDDGVGIVLDLDYSSAGELLDRLREAMGVMLAAQGNPLANAAVIGLEATRDTPGQARS